MGFSVFINLKNENEIEAVKTFVKEYYSYLEYINVNIDRYSGNKSVCAENLSIGILDEEEVSRIIDSISTGDFVKAITEEKFDISSLSMIVEGIVIAAADFNGGYLEYYAVSEEDDDNITKVTVSEKEGIKTEKLPYSSKIYKKVNRRYFEIMSETL